LAVNCTPWPSAAPAPGTEGSATALNVRPSSVDRYSVRLVLATSTTLPSPAAPANRGLQSTLESMFDHVTCSPCCPSATSHSGDAPFTRAAAAASNNATSDENTVVIFFFFVFRRRHIRFTLCTTKI
jgi:hypothetical protein